MDRSKGLFSRISQNYKSFSKGQKKIADFIENHYEQAVFMTASRLAESAGVSESTAVRFAVSLGYSGYPEFRRELEGMIMNRLNSVERMEVTYGNISESEILDKVMLSDVEKIRKTLEHCDREMFKTAVETILAAKRVYVIGIRSCAPLAAFLSFYLNQVLDDVRLVSTSNSSEIFEQMVRLTNEDVVIGISFPRYSMRTLKALEFANNRNARVIAITDSIHSPLNLYSSCNLIARSDMASIVDSLVAPLSLINALIVTLCMERKDHVVDTLLTMEKLWEEYQVYSKDDMDSINERMAIKEDVDE
ncbi:MAG: MurR/RpiR family transcriptional regulator [Eubacterium sp.]|nr:MurR/RpiR family transcriptional regulator [Eubacterium sp.]